MKIFLIIGALNAFLAVALGAFGAHGLEGKLSAKMLAVYKTGVQYHMFHAAGLVLVALLAEKFAGTSMITWAGWLMFIGIILFSGSLYVLSISGISILGAITPLGGLAFLAAWLLIVFAAFKVL
jgi:uncharacterized membrane protein YgdD (TMEM256/DUF423 family)